MNLFNRKLVSQACLILAAVASGPEAFALECRDLFPSSNADQQASFFLGKDFFLPLVSQGLMISQFALPHREKKDAACAAAAIVNSTHALYFSMSGGTHAVPERFSLAAASEIWQAVKQFGEMDAMKGIPEYMLPGLMLGAAKQFAMLDHVVPVGIFGSASVRRNVFEMITTRSRVRNIGVTDGSFFHVLTVLGFSNESKKIYVHDPNFASEILTYDLVIEESQVKLVPERTSPGVTALRRKDGVNGSLVVQTVFGLNIKETLKSAND